MLTILGMIQFPALILAIVGVFGIAPTIQKNLKENHNQSSGLIDAMSEVPLRTVSLYRDIQNAFLLNKKRVTMYQKKAVFSSRKRMRDFLNSILTWLLLVFILSVIISWVF